MMSRWGLSEKSQVSNQEFSKRRTPHSIYVSYLHPWSFNSLGRRSIYRCRGAFNTYSSWWAYYYAIKHRIFADVFFPFFSLPGRLCHLYCAHQCMCEAQWCIKSDAVVATHFGDSAVRSATVEAMEMICGMMCTWNLELWTTIFYWMEMVKQQFFMIFHVTM